MTLKWCDEVKGALEPTGRGAQARMLEYVNAALHENYSPGHFSDILNGKYDTSDIVGPVHEFLGWAPPVSALAARDDGRIVDLHSMTPAQRDWIANAIGRIDELSGDEARKMLAALLVKRSK